MNVLLEKDGQQIEYKTGAALYLLLAFIPLVGIFITFAMMIIRKQFRGIFLNQLVIGLIFGVLLVLAIILQSGTLLTIIYALDVVLAIVMIVMYAINANKYSVKQRLTEGYRVINLDDATVQQFVTEAEAVNTPFWQITKF